MTGVPPRTDPPVGAIEEIWSGGTETKETRPLAVTLPAVEEETTTSAGPTRETLPVVPVICRGRTTRFASGTPPTVTPVKFTKPVPVIVTVSPPNGKRLDGLALAIESVRERGSRSETAVLELLTPATRVPASTTSALAAPGTLGSRTSFPFSSRKKTAPERVAT